MLSSHKRLPQELGPMCLTSPPYSFPLAPRANRLGLCARPKCAGPEQDLPWVSSGGSDSVRRREPGRRAPTACPEPRAAHPQDSDDDVDIGGGGCAKPAFFLCARALVHVACPSILRVPSSHGARSALSPTKVKNAQGALIARAG